MVSGGGSRPLLCGALVLATVAGGVAPARAYPTDPSSQDLTRIRRLRWQEDVNQKKRRGRVLPPGALQPLSAIKLRLLDAASLDIPADAPRDPVLQAGLDSIVARRKWRRYNVALLDIT